MKNICSYIVTLVLLIFYSVVLYSFNKEDMFRVVIIIIVSVVFTLYSVYVLFTKDLEK